MSRSLILLGLTSALSLIALMPPDAISGTSYDPHGPGPDDDKMTVTLSDGSTVTDTPLNIVRRAQDGEFKLPDRQAASEVADKHNEVLFDKEQTTIGFVSGQDLPVEEPKAPEVSEGNGSASDALAASGTSGVSTIGSSATPSPAASPSASSPSSASPSEPAEGNASPSAASADDGSSASEKPASSTTDTSSAQSGQADTVEEPAAPSGPPINVSAPGPSTQIGSASTPSRDPRITEDNPVIPGTDAPPRPTGLEPPAPAPSPDANAASTGENTVQNGQSVGVDAAYANSPRAQAGNETELSGQKALEQTSATEQSTWTPSAALAPQTPTTLAEADQSEHMAGNGPSNLEARLAKIEKRLDELEIGLDHAHDKIETIEG